MGVFNSVCRCFMNPGDPASGLRSSEGKVPEPGVWREDEALGLLSSPAAALVAVAVAEAMITCRCVFERMSERFERVSGPWSRTTPRACDLR